jgi:hypothetical protein
VKDTTLSKSKITAPIIQKLKLCPRERTGWEEQNHFCNISVKNALLDSRSEVTADKPRSRDNLQNSLPVIFKSGQEGQEKTVELF